MAQETKSLGLILKDQRILMNLTLRQVETLTKISNAYLSQLENNRIKNPSVSVLSKLASFYRVDLQNLLITAGILKEKGAKKSKPISGFALSSDNLTEEEEDQLLQYLKFIRSQKQHGK